MIVSKNCIELHFIIKNSTWEILVLMLKYSLNNEQPKMHRLISSVLNVFYSSFRE